VLSRHSLQLGIATHDIEAEASAWSSCLQDLKGHLAPSLRLHVGDAVALNVTTIVFLAAALPRGSLESYDVQLSYRAESSSSTADVTSLQIKILPV